MEYIDVLEKIFGSRTESRILKFLVRHPGEFFRVGQVAKKTLSNYNTTHAYMKVFEEMGLLISKSSQQDKASGKTKKGEEGAKLYALNRDFYLFTQLRDLILSSFPTSEKELIRRLRSVGKIRVAVISGVFLGMENLPIDLFVVADDVEKLKFEKLIKNLEADVGQPLNYTLMDTAEFTYRFNIYDRFVRSIFQKPHKKIIDDLNI